MSAHATDSETLNKRIIDAQILDFLLLSPIRADVLEGIDIKLIREEDFADFATFRKATQEIIGGAVTGKPQALVLVVYSDTLDEARKYMGNGDFISGLGLDLRAPRLQSYHSGFSGIGFDRILDIRPSAGSANQPTSQNYSPNATAETPLKAFRRRENLMYHRYEIGNKRSIYLFAERRRTSSFAPTREYKTVNYIKTLETLSTRQPLSLHPFWLFEKLLAAESQLLDGFLIKTGPHGGFDQYIQDLHEIMRSLITLEHSNQRYISVIDNLIVDLAVLSNEASSLGAEYELHSESEARLKDGLLCLQNLCKEKLQKFKNRKQRAQNLIKLLYNLTANRDSLTSLDIARANADIARDTKRDNESMNTIAILTMLYLPATLVCSFFGTNFFSLNVKDDEHQIFLVSHLCWVYFLTTLLLTAFTVCVWLRWQRRVRGREQT